MNNKSISLVVWLLSICPAMGQISKSEALNSLDQLGGVYYAYQTPTWKQTPTPRGYEPFYISHYGRHGSRFTLGDHDASRLADILRRAKVQGALTHTGHRLLIRLDSIAQLTEYKGGALTSLGVKQQRGIAERMYRSFPQIFRGDAPVSARSTTVVRCVLSMDAMCERLKELNPALRMNRESDNDYQRYLNHHTERNGEFNSSKGPWYEEHRKFEQSHLHTDRLMNSLFTPEFTLRCVNPESFMYDLYWVAADMQDVERAPSLYEFFTPEEYFDIWQIYNYKNYVCDAPSPLNCYAHAANAVPLLRNIIESADQAIVSGNSSATLRFGHDGNLLPLCGLLRIEGSIASETRTDHIYEAWTNFRIVPMAANLQMIFFRHKKNPSDIIVKLMLNEHEAKIPLATDMAPFYHWDDLRAYCMEAMEKAEAYQFQM